MEEEVWKFFIENLIMKILSWNVGLPSYYKYADKLNVKINWESVSDQFFCLWYKECVIDVITSIDPDIVLLQEIKNIEQRDAICNALNYDNIIDIWIKSNTQYPRLYLSKMPFEERVRSTNDWIILENWIYVKNIHLNAFSAKKRELQIEELTKKLKDWLETCLLWDFNIWQFGQKVLFKHDRIALDCLNKVIPETSKSFWSTTMYGAKLDRVFSTLQWSVATVIPKKWAQMDHYPILLEF